MNPMAGWKVLERKTYSLPVRGMIDANIPYSRLKGKASAAAIGMAISRLLCGNTAGCAQYVNMMYTTPTLATFRSSIRHGEPTRTNPEDSRLKICPEACTPATGLATASLIVVLLTPSTVGAVDRKRDFPGCAQALGHLGGGRYRRSPARTMGTGNKFPRRGGVGGPETRGGAEAPAGAPGRGE